MKTIDEIMARIYSSFCLLKMYQRDLTGAREFIALSLEKWRNAENINTLPYLFAIKNKCLLHLSCREEGMAIETATIYLEQTPETDETVTNRMWFMKFLADRGNQKYKEDLRRNIEALSHMMPPEQLSLLLRKLGLISKRPSGDKSISSS